MECSGIGEDARMCPVYQRAAREAAEKERDDLKARVKVLEVAGVELRIECGKWSCYAERSEYPDVQAVMDAWDEAVKGEGSAPPARVG